MQITRREAIRLGTRGAALAIAAGALVRPAAAAARKIPIALGLWSVREEAQKDLAGVLGAVADMGYQGVELAHSDYGHDAATWRKLLDKNGLKACGMHTLADKLTGDGFRRMVDFHKAIGNRYLILAALPAKNLTSIKGLLEAAKLLDELAEKLRSEGMKIGYHCHGGDFHRTEGQIPWVVLGEKTRPEVIMQLDVGNCLQGGGDYLAMLDKFAKRAVTVHLKEFGGKPGALIGEGSIRWSEVFRICETKAPTEWYIVEEESQKGPASLDACRRSLQNLRKMGK